MALQIGAQYYTIRDFCQTLEDFRESCKKVAEIGYKTVQLSGIGDFKAEEIKPILPNQERQHNEFVQKKASYYDSSYAHSEYVRCEKL